MSALSRMLEIETPLGPDVFIVERFSGSEGLGRLSEYQAGLVSKRKNISAKDILGKSVTVSMACGGDRQRHYNGFVTRFALLGQVATTAYKDGVGYAYRITVRPWLWFLTRASTCKIYQNKAIPAVIKEVLERPGYSQFCNFESRLSGSYQPWENCVQYRETDFNFISRLMEQEGIYYWFEHAMDKHVLVLADDMGKHEPHPDLAAIEFNATATEAAGETPYVSAWDTVLEIQPGSYAIDDYDFEKPRAALAKVKKISRSHDQAEFEIFDYPGEYVVPGEGEHYAQVRIEELQSQHEISQAACNAQEIEVGRLITLTEHPVEALNQEYLITAASFQATDSTPSSGAGGQDFHCSFTVMPKGAAPFRPARTTPKPIVQGPQTAVVVGKAGEEIWTDKYGRVKVQFHWDRYGKSNEDSSCWIRVSQPWAGKNWGAVALPRIGQEVIVSFLEGDPDWPIITGRVYNADQMPPYALPDNQTRTGIVSHSSLGGGKDNFNELRFEDKAGSEQVFMHAEKDLEFRTKHDRVEWVGNESHLMVAKDTLEKLDADYHLTLKGDHNEKLDGSLSFKVERDMHVKVAQTIAQDAGQEIHLKGGMKVIIEAGSQLSLKVGGSFVNIGPSGVDIKGPLVQINSGGSAGSGSGASPIAPKVPREADNGKGGETGAPPGPPKPPQPGSPGPQAAALQQAAASGAPFCAVCQGGG